MADIDSATNSSNNIVPKNHDNLVLIIFIIICFITTFIGGFYLKTILLAEESGQHIQPSPSNINSPKPTPISTAFIGDEQESTKFIPGSYYFDDTIIILTKEKPYKAIIASVTRNGKELNYTQTTRVSIYDGNNWSRKVKGQTNNNSAIVGNELVNSWKIDTDPSRVLKFNASGDISLNNMGINFNTGTLVNEITTRSLPGYTKFISQKEGIVTIDGLAYPAYYLYTKIYSLNSSEIQFYNQPFGVTTDWVVFWAKDGSFLHIDKTDVPKPTEIYQSHQIGILVSPLGQVSKTFSLDVVRNSIQSPDRFKIQLTNPVAKHLEFDRLNMIEKAPNGSYTWQMGIIEGKINNLDEQGVEGIGLVEYIHN